MQKHPTQQNIENYRVIRAKTRRVIKPSKRHSWQTYVSKINSRTSIKKVWSVVRKIAGKSPATNIKHLNLNNTEITEIPDIANSLGQTFSNNSSSNNYRTKFQGFINKAENQHLKFKSNNLETYNNPFSLDELRDAISKSNDSAVGPDDSVIFNVLLSRVLLHPFQSFISGFNRRFAVFVAPDGIMSVSYTHLTLPTIYSV